MHVSKIGYLQTHFALSLLIFFFASGAQAGADPTPTDWLPQFNKITLINDDIVFDAELAQIRIVAGQMGGVNSLIIDNLAERKQNRTQQSLPCSIPNEILSQYRNQFQEAQIWYCESPERMWFASAGYCGEGDDEPEVNLGYLYSYSPQNRQVQKYSGFIPRCAELVGLARANNSLVGVTIYQEEYSRGAGEVVILDLNHVKSPPKVLRNPHSTGAVVGLSAYDKQHDSLWFATEEGIEQLTLNNAKWNQRYFDFEVTADNRLGITLSLQKPSDEKMWLGRILHNYPIKDLRGFVTAWQQATPPKYQGETRVSPLLLPHYMDAAINSRNWENDWIYRGLLYIISSHQDAPSKEVATVFIANELKRPQSLANRGELFVVAKKLGIPITQEMRSAYFNDVIYNYFIRPKTNRWAKNNVVKIAFEHPEYLPQLRDYYRSHIITFDVEDGFLDEVRGYSSWPNYQVLADVINEGQTRFKYRRDLLEMCGRNETPRNENALLSILQARLETDSQAKYLDDPNVYDGTERCIQASINWINYGGKDQVGRRVNLMLNVAIEHKELANIILEILNSRFNWTIHNIEEWKRQWTKTYVSEVNTNGACANEMKTCINNPYGCVSLGIPAETSKCDGMCASEIIGKLRTAGVSVAAPHASPNAPLGCVGYRADIAGTEAGAKCIANVLGYEYMPWGCSGDGYSYNVRAR